MANTNYSVAVVDLDGNIKALVDAHDLAITTRINGGLEGSFKLDVLDPLTSEVAVAKRAIKVWRNGVLRAHGKITEPLEDDSQWTTVAFADPFYWLGLRRVQSKTTYTAEDAGSIVFDLIDTQEARGTVRLAKGTRTPSHKRTREYDSGQVVSEAITELAELDDGFYFRLDPVDNVAGTHAEIVILYPDAGQERPRVRFEYGDGTLDNLSEFKRELRVPRNRIKARGNGASASASDTDSIAEYDLIEDEISLSNVKKRPILSAHAQGALTPAPPVAYSVTPTTEAPMLWDSFAVGDTVHLTIRHGRVQDVDVLARINEVTVKVDDDGVESMDEIVLEVL